MVIPSQRERGLGHSVFIFQAGGAPPGEAPLVILWEPVFVLLGYCIMLSYETDLGIWSLTLAINTIFKCL